MRTALLIAVAALAAVVLILTPVSPPEVRVARLERSRPAKIAGPGGRPPLYAVEEFSTAGGTDAEMATLVGGVLRQDLEFEGALHLVTAAAATETALQSPPADPAAGTATHEADALVRGRVSQSGDRLDVEVRIVSARTGDEAFARGYSGPAGLARTVAHMAADEIHLAQAGVDGVSRTRLAFVSDRGGVRRELGGLLRRFKEVWVADYDGANERQVTRDGDLDMTPSWSPDGAAVAYTSMRRGPLDVFVSFLEERRVENPTRGMGANSLPAWSPDGARIAFTSTRNGNEEIYVMNRDGSDLRRLTHHPAIDTSPAWSADGSRLAFTSNRTGSPQIWTMNADGADPRALTSEKHCDRPAWSPPPYQEIAYASRTKTGFDIKIIDLATGDVRQLTFGPGLNESPAYAPNGRHIAFSSTRRHGEQVWVVPRTGGEPRQLTRIGNNKMPAWSR